MHTLSRLLGANIRSLAISYLYRNIPSADLLDLNRPVTSGEVEGVKAQRGQGGQGGQGGGGSTRKSIGYGNLATFPRILQASRRVIAEVRDSGSNIGRLFREGFQLQGIYVLTYIHVRIHPTA